MERTEMQDEVRLTSYSHGGGCACKLGVDELAEVLGHLRLNHHDPALLVGLEDGDDAAVFKVGPEAALVQTVDFFTPIVDDARAWGAIAAANALSDVYAMGGRPATALNLVAWPRDLDFEILGRVLDGAAEVCARAGTTVVGGHSIDDPEPKFGLAVTGFVHPERIIRKTGAPPDCDLVLTKPLGVGVLASGIKQGQTSAVGARVAVETMSALNDAACEAMLACGPAAATDVTGFGLVGHLLQMLQRKLSAELELSAVPMISEAVELVARGVYPGGSARNRTSGGGRVSADGLDPARTALLYDAQTSGGLLIAIDPSRTDDLLGELHDRGVDDAAHIGRIVAGDGSIRVV